jgi:hypothetical protein
MGHRYSDPGVFHRIENRSTDDVGTTTSVGRMGRCNRGGQRRWFEVSAIEQHDNAGPCATDSIYTTLNHQLTPDGSLMF